MQELTERPEDLIRSTSLLVLLFGDEACAPCHARSETGWTRG